MSRAAILLAFAACAALAAARPAAGAGAPTAASSPAQPTPRPQGPEKPKEPPTPTRKQATICQTIETAAHDNGLPPEFLARLIWQESSFNPNAVSWAGAQGVAQFMPPTAAERGLADPFDPAQAIPASAAFLKNLRGDFGNLGLAAAAYNAGPRRLQGWLAGDSALPWETQAYVKAITGYTADQWASAGSKPQIAGQKKSTLFPLDCRQVVALLGRPGANAVIRPRIIAPWGVVISVNFSRTVALAAFSRVQKRYASVLAGIDPLVMSKRMRSRGFRPIYDVRLPAQSRTTANTLCGRLQRAGGSCIVLRN